MGPKVCPFCFKKIYFTSKLEYLCNNSQCENHKNNNPIVGGKVDKKGLCKCDKCGRPTGIMRCPDCGNTLPKKFLDADTNIIAIVGGKSTGKSYFVGSLIRQIMDQSLLARSYPISTMWADGVMGKSRDEYIRRFKTFMDGRQEIPGTTFAADLIKDYPPILIELKKDAKGLFQKSILEIFSFFDAAGEGFERESDLAAVTPYLSHASAIILILDPRQIGSVDEAVKSAFPNIGAKTDMTYEEILTNVVNQIRTEAGKRNGKLDIPICVCVSKWDLVMKTPELLPKGLLISEFSKKGSNYDEAYIDNTSEEIRSVLRQWDPNLVNMVEQDFSRIRYFVFSAWGTPETGNKATPALAPYRVEDPLLWILNKQKVI